MGIRVFGGTSNLLDFLHIAFVGILSVVLTNIGYKYRT